MVRNLLLDDYIGSRMDRGREAASRKTPTLDVEFGIMECHYLWVAPCTMFSLSLGPLIDA
jgi:hypothetical protein